MVSTTRLTSATRLGAAAAAGVLALTGLVAVTGTASGVPPVGSSLRTPLSAAAAGEGDEDWTLMIYDVADTSNIAGDMITNLAAFTELPEMDNVNVVAMVDLPERTDPGYPQATLPGIEPFTTAKLLVLEDGRWNEIRDLGEVSMGRPDVLATFIEESANRFPASKYGLVLSDHGGAWSGGYVDTGPPSTSQLAISDMRAGIITGMQRADEPIERFEFIDHDSCLMASYEAASALGPLTENLVASEEATFGDSTLDLDALASLGQDVSGEDWGLSNIQGYAVTADGYDGVGDFSALSVVDGGAMARLDAAVEAFADVAVANMAEVAPELARARGRSLEFVTALLGEEAGDGYSVVDLGDFLRQLENVPTEVEVARDAVFAALDAAVLHQVTRRATEQATGLNVFFPETPDQARGYVAQGIAPPGWARLVAAYADFAEQSGGPGGSAEFVSETADVLEIGPGGIRIGAQLQSGDEDDVASAETQVLTQLDGRDVLAVALPAYLDSGGPGQVQGVWDFSVTTVQAGKRRVPASAVYQAQSGGLLGWFQALYTAPDGSQTDVEFSVLLSSEGEVESVSVTDVSLGGAQAGIDLENGGTLTPYLIVPSSGGFQLELSTSSVPVNDRTEVSYLKLAAGTSFDMGVAVTDLTGSSSTALVTETVR